MNLRDAAQIADLVNKQNGLIGSYSAQNVLRCSDEFLYTSDTHGNVTACIRLRPVQWYQYEVCNASVDQSRPHYAVFYRLFKKLLFTAQLRNAHILQATTADHNRVAQKFLIKFGFKSTSRFSNSKTGNIVIVWQKVMV